MSTKLITSYNNSLRSIQDKFDTILTTTKTYPNHMDGNLDMNNNDINGVNYLGVKNISIPFNEHLNSIREGVRLQKNYLDIIKNNYNYLSSKYIGPRNINPTGNFENGCLYYNQVDRWLYVYDNGQWTAITNEEPVFLGYEENLSDLPDKQQALLNLGLDEFAQVMVTTIESNDDISGAVNFVSTDNLGEFCDNIKDLLAIIQVNLDDYVNQLNTLIDEVKSWSLLYDDGVLWGKLGQINTSLTSNGQKLDDYQDDVDNIRDTLLYPPGTAVAVAYLRYSNKFNISTQGSFAVFESPWVSGSGSPINVSSVQVLTTVDNPGYNYPPDTYNLRIHFTEPVTTNYDVELRQLEGGSFKNINGNYYRYMNILHKSTTYCDIRYGHRKPAGYIDLCDLIAIGAAQTPLQVMIKSV